MTPPWVFSFRTVFFHSLCSISFPFLFSFYFAAFPTLSIQFSIPFHCVFHSTIPVKTVPFLSLRFPLNFAALCTVSIQSPFRFPFHSTTFSHFPFNCIFTLSIRFSIPRLLDSLHFSYFPFNFQFYFTAFTIPVSTCDLPSSFLTGPVCEGGLSFFVPQTLLAALDIFDRSEKSGRFE